MSDTTISTDTLTATDGTRIFFRACVPKDPKAIVLVLHGYAEHSGRYERVLTHLAGRGFAAYAPDHRGHGKTADVLGYVADLDAIVSDVLRLRTKALEDHSALPVFLIGHSMGGLISLLHTQRYPTGLSGVVTSGVAVSIPPDISKIVIKLSHVLGRIIPKVGIQPFFDPTKMTRDVAEQERVKVDPLFYRGKVRARTGSNLLKGIGQALDRLGEIQTPMLIMHGGSDALVPSDASETVYARIASSDKEHEIYPEAYHELFQDPDTGDVLDRVGAWIEARVPKAK